MAERGRPWYQVLDRLSDVIAGLDEGPETDEFVTRLEELVTDVSGCRFEGFRAPSGTWYTGSSAGVEPLDAAVHGARAGSRRDGEMVLVLEGRAWVRGFPMSGVKEAPALLVVSSLSEPVPDVVARLRALALGVRLAHAAWESALLRQQGAARRGAALTAPGPDIGSVRRSQQRLARAVTEGAGLAGIAVALADIAGQGVRIWDHQARRLAQHPPDTATQAPGDPAGLTALTIDSAEPWRDGAWWCAAVRSDGKILGVVGIHDPDGVTDDAAHLALEQAAIATALELFRLRSVAGAELRLWGELASELLFDPNTERVRSHAEALGYDLDRPHQVAVVHGGVPPHVLFDAVVVTLRAMNAAGTATTVGDDVAVIVAGDADWNGFADRLIGRIGEAQIGLGTVSPTGVKLAGSLREADFALRIGRAIGRRGVAPFEDLGLYRLLAIEGNPTELHRYVDRWLGPLLAYDAEHRSQLTRTLATYLESGGSLERTAKELFIHRSTLKGRLARAGALLHRDLNDPDVRFNLQLASRTRATFDALRTGGPVVSSSPDEDVQVQ